MIIFYLQNIAVFDCGHKKILLAMLKYNFCTINMLHLQHGYNFHIIAHCSIEQIYYHQCYSAQKYDISGIIILAMNALIVLNTFINLNELITYLNMLRKHILLISSWIRISLYIHFLKKMYRKSVYSLTFKIIRAILSKQQV